TGEYPKEAPFTIAELEEIYPCASGKSKEDDDYKERALLATKELQGGRAGYQALLNHILTVSVNDLKRNYEKLNVSFDLWKGESDAQEYIPDMVEDLKKKELAYESDGALVVDVALDSDKKEVPPCMILKSDGASLYTTTDLATLVWRVKDYNPDKVIYVVDNRQEMHFIQVFRCAKKAGIVGEDVSLEFLGFGTMNGPGGKPFKTRDGGVMRLEYLLNETSEKMYSKIMDNNNMSDDEAKKVADTVALAALKYGDLSNQASKDYIFDVDKFTSSEGNTGPYILYTIVRIKSILNKYAEVGSVDDTEILPPDGESSKKLMLELVKFQNAIINAYEENEPSKICAFIYELCNAFNHFYHETKILSCEDEDKKKGYIALLKLTVDVLNQCIDLLGFYAPDRM
nr:arginine--tRNA ligase [Lachnospiraceae bacterium]